MTDFPNKRELKVLVVLASGDPAYRSDSSFYGIGEGTFAGMMKNGWITQESNEFSRRLQFRITNAGQEVRKVLAPKRVRRPARLSAAPPRLSEAPPRLSPMPRKP